MFLDQSPHDTKLVSGLLIHACDLIGPAQRFEVASAWSKKLAVEFTNQVFYFLLSFFPPFSIIFSYSKTLEEKKLGLTVSPFMKGLD